jgi:2-dehydropantoate 2-reductase
MLTASMYRDLQKNSLVEADHILGDLLRRGNALGLESSLLQAAYVQLSVYMAGREGA